MSVRLLVGMLCLLLLGGCRSREQRVSDAGPPPQSRPTGLRYAQRVTEMRLESPTGPVVGRIHPGARADVDVADAGWVRVVLPEGFKDQQDNRITVFAQDVFGTSPVPLPTVDVPGRVVKNTARLDLRAAADAAEKSPFATTMFCGELHVLSAADASPAQVAQLHAGIELVGWVSSAQDVRRGLARCDVRHVVRKQGQLLHFGGSSWGTVAELDAVPEGYLGSDLREADDLASLIASSGSMYWLMPTARATTVCREWQFVRLPDDTPSPLVLVRTAPITYDKRRAFVSFGASYSRPGLLLLGPHFTWAPLDKAPWSKVIGGYRCAVPYTFAGTRDGALRMSVVGAAKDSELVAWHPDDEERWYLTAAACDAARRRADEALQKNPTATPPGGVHLDCFDELAEP